MIRVGDRILDLANEQARIDQGRGRACCRVDVGVALDFLIAIRGRVRVPPAKGQCIGSIMQRNRHASDLSPRRTVVNLER